MPARFGVAALLGCGRCLERAPRAHGRARVTRAAVARVGLMAKAPLSRIVEMLSSDALEKRIAAAIVLGELGTKSPAVTRALVDALAEDNAALQRHVIEALGSLGAAEQADAVVAFVAARDAGLRAAAVNALVAFGESIVPVVEARLAEATGEERKALDGVLARLGGKEAFIALLAALEDADEQAANAAAVAMRERAREADAKMRRAYLTQLEKVLAAQAKKKGEVNHAAVRAALKMMGYLEDERATDTLLKHATAAKQPPGVRQEALIALRFIHKDKKPDIKLINALVVAAADPDRALAQAALMTLAGIDLPAKSADRLAPLTGHEDAERARFVIDMLSHRDSPEAVAVLVDVLATQELRRARVAADALAGKPGVASPLAGHLAATVDRERGQLLVKVLTPICHELKPADRKKLLGAVTLHLERGEPGWQSPLDIMRCAHPPEADAALRDLYQKLKRRKPPERATEVLRLLCRSRDATHEDRYELGSRLLGHGIRDTAPSAREADESLRIFGFLLRQGFDLTTALRKDRSLDLDTLYYVGFHFIEEDHPVGEELLQQVVQQAGRKKLGKMAKNKLELAGRAA